MQERPTVVKFSNTRPFLQKKQASIPSSKLMFANMIVMMFGADNGKKLLKFAWIILT